MAKNAKRTGLYREANGRYVYKTQEEYKDQHWECKGTSMINAEMAKQSWKNKRERKIAEIEGNVAQKTGKVKLRDSINEWYSNYKKVEKRSGRTRSARTIDTDMDTINQIIMRLGNYNVCDIDSDVIQKYLLWLVDSGASQSTIRKRWNMLNMFFRHTYPKIDDNPMSRCRCPQSKKGVAGCSIDDEDEPTDKLAYTEAEMEQLKNELAKPYNTHSGWHTNDRGYSVGNLLIVIMYEFLRVSEAVELRVKDVLWDENLIYIRRQYDEKNKLVAIPKYGSKRKVPIMHECRELLKEACAGKKPEDLLFCAGNIYNADKLKHDGHILHGRLRDNLNCACERVGIEKHTIHDLRHDGISLTVNKGIKAQSVMRWAGHKSLTVTLDKYYRQSRDEDADDMQIACGL